MRRLHTLFLILVLIVLEITVEAQNHPTLNDQHARKDRFSFFMGTTLVPLDVSREFSEQYLYVPTYGIGYERLLTKWLAVGLVSEIELQNYVIQDKDGENISRNNIWVTSIPVYFIPFNHFAVYMGPGYELTSDQNFAIFKFGLLYSYKFNDKWDMAPEIVIDQVSNKYATFTFGLSIGRKF